MAVCLISSAAPSHAEEDMGPFGWHSSIEWQCWVPALIVVLLLTSEDISEEREDADEHAGTHCNGANRRLADCTQPQVSPYVQ